MPYRPYDLTSDVIGDFSYTYVDIPFSRHVAFSDEGLLEHLTIEWWTASKLEIDTQRCGGVVVENYEEFGDWPSDYQRGVTVYYYGCDDFVLPAPLPEL